MNLDNLLDEVEDKILDEAKYTSALEYKRHWVEWDKDFAEKYNKEHGTHMHGCYEYDHRVAAGATFNDGTVVHNKDHNKNNNKKKNLMKVSRAEHCIIDPNALKHKGEKCKVPGCGKPYYSHGFCYNHYMQDYRKKKNKSKD